MLKVLGNSVLRFNQSSLDYQNGWFLPGQGVQGEKFLKRDSGMFWNEFLREKEENNLGRGNRLNERTEAWKTVSWMTDMKRVE
jgi:hypothetical protein